MTILNVIENKTHLNLSKTLQEMPFKKKKSILRKSTNYTKRPAYMLKFYINFKIQITKQYLLIPVCLDFFFFLNEQKSTTKKYNTSLSCLCYKELIFNPCIPRAITINGGGWKEQGHVSPGSATSLVWDLRQTLTSTGFDVYPEW